MITDDLLDPETLEEVKQALCDGLKELEKFLQEKSERSGSHDKGRSNAGGLSFTRNREKS